MGIAGDGISSVAAVMMWRLLAGLNEGVGGLSGLGGLADNAEGRCGANGPAGSVKSDERTQTAKQAALRLCTAMGRHDEIQARGLADDCGALN